DYLCAMASVLQPIGAKTVADAEDYLARVLAELEKPRQPLPLFPIALLLCVQEPLQAVGLGPFYSHGLASAGMHHFTRVEMIGKLVQLVWARQNERLAHSFGRDPIPDLQLSGTPSIHNCRPACPFRITKSPDLKVSAMARDSCFRPR